MQRAEEQVILVDRDDAAIGVAGKLEAHRRALLHRAFSVFLYDERGRVLLQRRSAAKYHSGGLWANACCGHPRPGESVMGAAIRRVREELGVVLDDVTDVGSFVYRADVGEGLVEHEIDHVLVGALHGEPKPDADEISEVRWMSARDLERDMTERPLAYAPWLREALRVAQAARANA